MAHPDLREELRIRLAGAGFEIAAEGIGYQPRHGSYLFQVDLLREMTEGIIVNGVDAVTLHIGEIITEADGRKQVQVRDGGKGGKTFDERDDPAYSVRTPDLLHQLGYLAVFPGIDPEPPPRFIQQITDRLGLRQLQKGFSPEILREMDHRGMNFACAVLGKVNVVMPPVMREVGTYEDNIA